MGVAMLNLGAYSERDLQHLLQLLKQMHSSNKSVRQGMADVGREINRINAEHSSNTGKFHLPAGAYTDKCPECGGLTKDRVDEDTGEMARVCQQCWFSWIVE
ncbi:hypothetical protein SAMN05660330_03728 [Desulforhopalus singaporensis]|uniref:Uncharacterized protein n=1 Tax=Desulforhopalus singaporensis TaxID=91360 RepID=A0A1H0UUH4_9BACT|nr:hypothetical protein SAMN05660330_03728 [Desulforhopalus singaporensis]